MNPSFVPDLIRQRQADLLLDAQQHRLAATARRLRTRTGARHRPAFCGTPTEGDTTC
ncbi:hypothetical protein HC031_02470 [Planosporangium thailandense]|uniref:Uncharacterized protein n=1 Tax=Planosporangium thailandense TaxID=765197 RepID=A0ABX0XRK7_9ACTN|nr:hypothetical protein [Planosporangium thailandense]NJC68593.1 hypothetical protein [Planosporangium thailandense]